MPKRRSAASEARAPCAADDAALPDVDSLLSGLRRRLLAGRRQLLGRAVGLHQRSGLRILDATAGLGRDAMLLASLGAEVDACERHDQVYERLCATAARLPARARGRLRLHHADSLQLMTGQQWDVVYLDPMYTPTGKAALPQAAAQQLRALVGADDDADALLAPARAAAQRRVVVKRALRAPVLAATSPMEQLRGNSVRFDIYAPATRDTAS